MLLLLLNFLFLFFELVVFLLTLLCLELCTLSQLFTCDLMTCVLNSYREILYVEDTIFFFFSPDIIVMVDSALKT